MNARIIVPIALLFSAGFFAACVGDTSTPPGGNDAGVPDTGVQDTGSDTVTTPDAGCGDTMTSHDNCGKCGNVCGSTENCFDGVCDGDKLVDVAAGSISACVVLKSGAVYCWGANDTHQLAADSGGTTCAGSTPCSPKALRVVGVSDAVQVDVGDGAACVVRATGGVSCWGLNNQGQLGHANGDDICNGQPCNKNPIDVIGLPMGDPAVQVIVGGQTDRAFTCALTKAGAVFCWGSNVNGDLGNTTLTPTKSSSPVPVAGVQVNALHLAATHNGGNPGVCATMGDKTLRCWGAASSWMGGRDPAQANGACGCYPNAGTPTLSGTDDMIALALTDAVTVGVHSNGTGVAWGFTGYATNPSSTPTPVTAIPSLPSVVGVSAGPVHACAWTAAGAVWCWGTNVWGALGTGDFNGGSTCVPGSCSKVALAVSSLSAKRVSAGYDFTVAIGDHTAMAFGIDDVAELGHSLALDVTCNTNHKCAPSPTKVEGIPGTK